MRPDEAAGFGPLLSELVTAIEDVAGAERVYLAAFGEVFEHPHVLVAARDPAIAPDQRGPRLLIERDALVDVDRALAVAGDLRRRLAGVA